MKQQTEKERKIINWFIKKINKIDKILLEITKGEKEREDNNY